jgi:hypothetical protein
MSTAIYNALCALMGLGQNTQTVFWHERFTDAEQTFRLFASNHADAVELVDDGPTRSGHSLRLVMRGDYTEIATLRLDAIERAVAALSSTVNDDAMWSPSQHARAS